MRWTHRIGLSLLLVIAVVPRLPAQTIIDQWTSVQAPPVPVLQQVQLQPATTALLLLDFVKQTCNASQRPRCLATLPAVSRFATAARTHGVRVIYSITHAATPADIVAVLKPRLGETMVQSGVDKFLNTKLDSILHEDGITTVIVTGTTAEGAVLSTATEAALRGYRVIVPVDGMSAASLYPEQYVAWNLLHSPGTAQHVCLTQTSMIDFAH